jgi:hypothetical protein
MMARMDAGAPQSLPAPLLLRAARSLLVLLALLLPFEAPLFRLGPLQLTTVELALYATLMAWGLVIAFDVLGGRFSMRSLVAALRGESMVQAALFWTAVLFASAAAAPSHRTAAVKFALRSLSGVLVFFAARMLARPPEVARRVVWAVVVGALVSAAAAMVEWLVPSTTIVWRPFREHDFDVLGLARASGSFAYPTIAAMYWEAAVPLAVVAPFLADTARREPRSMRSGAAVVGSALLFSAILASATRSGLAGAAAACAALLWTQGRSGPSMRRTLIGVLLVACALALSAAGFRSLLGQRLRWWHDDRWFGVEYGVETTPRIAGADQTFSVAVALRNTGTLTWLREGTHPTRLSYHWERLGGPTTRADFEGARTDLPGDVPPGGGLQVVATVYGPAAEGQYLLRWDLVQEQVTWFSEQGNPMPSQRFDVRASPGEPATEPPGGPTEAATASVVVYPPPPPRIALWRAAIVLWREHPLLGIGPDNFRRRYQAVLSPSPTGQPYTDTRIHANSFYLETLSDLGLVGIGALAAIAIALVHLVRRHYAAGYLLGLGTGVGVGAFFVHGVLDYFLEFTPLFGLFWLLLGLTAAGDVVTSKEPSQP